MELPMAEAKHRWSPSTRVILSALSRPQKSVIGDMRNTKMNEAGAWLFSELSWPHCPCTSGTEAFRSAAVLSRAGFLE